MIPNLLSHTFAFLSMPSGGEWLLAFLILLLLFGRRLPEVGRSLGQGIHEFKKALHGPTSGPADSNQNPLPPAQLGAGKDGASKQS